MIIQKNTEIETQDSFFLETKNHIFYWKGLLFIKGFLSGEESVKELDRLLTAQSPEEVTGYLHGQFACFIHKKNTSEYYAFSDNSGLGYLVYNKNSISFSFLELIRRTDKKNLNLNPEKIVEFIITGSIHRYETIFDSINLLKPNEILYFPTMTIRKKVDIFYRSENPKNNFKKIFTEISNCVKNNKISIDLTGGTDSRTVIALFHYAGLPFETSCVIPGSLQLESAKRTAELLKLEFSIIHQKIDKNTINAELQEVFTYCDGMMDVLFNHRLWQLDLARRKEDITLTIECSGGELYKDALWWRTAFFSKNTNDFIKKMAYSGKANWDEERTLSYFLFSPDVTEILNNHKSKTLQYLLSRYASKNKFLAADSLFYDYSIKFPRSRQNGIPFYSVLLENKLVQIGTKIPKHERILHSFYRNLITPISTDVAKLPVNRLFGMSMSNKMVYILKDLSQYIIWPIYNSLRRKRLQKSVFSIYDCVRELKRTRENLELLKSCNIINRELDVKNIPDLYLGRCYTIAELLRILDAKP